MKEIWMDIKDYEGLYKISNKGRVKSFNNKNNPIFKKTLFRMKPFIMRQNINRNGYYYIILSKNSKKKTCTIHRLVVKAFLPRIIDKSDINHKDGVKTNNILSNLEWCNESENGLHAYRIGLQKPIMGEKHGRHKLNHFQVQRIRLMREIDSSLSQKRIAEMFKATQGLISAIENKRLWSHI